MNNADAFCSRMRIGIGAEYIPNLIGRSYFAHVKYRLGAYYSLPYYKIEGERAATAYPLRVERDSTVCEDPRIESNLCR